MCKASALLLRHRSFLKKVAFVFSKVYESFFSGESTGGEALAQELVWEEGEPG